MKRLVRQSWLYILLWFMVNLGFALLIPIDADEAYYWVFSWFPAWGYLDHPPFTALLIALGRWIPGTLGVRVLPVAMMTASVWLLWKLTDPDERPPAGLFFLLAAAVPLLFLFSSFALPDIPLLFFSLLCLFCYRRMTEAPSWRTALLWGLTMAAIGYSKYTGFLLIAVLLLGTPGLLHRRETWLAIATALLLMVPHVMWQMSHGFPSFTYHLVERARTFRWNYLWEFWLNLAVVFNPLFVPVYIRAWRVPLSRNRRFNRVLRILAIGLPLFFLPMIFRGHVQPQWLFPVTIPALFLLAAAVKRLPGWRNYIVWSAAFTAALLVTGKILLATDLVVIKPDIQASEAIPATICEKAEERPVVVLNSYRTTALCAFYLKNPAVPCIAVFPTRPTQYGLWETDTLVHHKDILLVGDSSTAFSRFSPYHGSTIYLSRIDSFPSVSRVSAVILPGAENLEASAEEVKVEIANPYPYRVDLSEGSCLSFNWIVVKGKRERVIRCIPLLLPVSELPPNSLTVFRVPVPAGVMEYPGSQVGVSLCFSTLAPYIPGNLVPVRAISP